jgi:hypothetical protein
MSRFILLVISLVLVVYIRATSATQCTDTISYWTENVDDPVYTPPYTASELPDDYYPSVIYDKQRFHGHGDSVKYKMWYQYPDGVAYATSDDGIAWTSQRPHLLANHTTRIGERSVDPSSSFFK